MGNSYKDNRKRDTIKPRKPKTKKKSRGEIKDTLKNWEFSDWENLSDDRIEGVNDGSRNDRE